MLQVRTVSQGAEPTKYTYPKNTSRVRHIKSTGNGIPQEISVPVFCHKLVLALPEPTHSAEHDYSSTANQHMNLKGRTWFTSLAIVRDSSFQRPKPLFSESHLKFAHSKNLM